MKGEVEFEEGNCRAVIGWLVGQGRSLLLTVWIIQTIFFQTRPYICLVFLTFQNSGSLRFMLNV